MFLWSKHAGRWLRFASLHKARVENNVSDMMSSKDPSQKPLQTEAITAVGAGAILALEDVCAGREGRKGKRCLLWSLPNCRVHGAKVNQLIFLSKRVLQH
jgi:hypothetical protein